MSETAALRRRLFDLMDALRRGEITPTEANRIVREVVRPWERAAWWRRTKGEPTLYCKGEPTLYCERRGSEKQGTGDGS